MRAGAACYKLHKLHTNDRFGLKSGFKILIYRVYFFTGTPLKS